MRHHITTHRLRLLLDEQRLMTIGQLADLLDMSRQAVQQRIGKGDLPPAIGRVGQVKGGVLVWDREEVLDYRTTWPRR